MIPAESVDPTEESWTASTYPRVLVVTNVPFSWQNSNGKAMSSLFVGWPKDRLAQVYVPFVTPQPPMFDVCENFWALTPLGLRRVVQRNGQTRRPPPRWRTWIASKIYESPSRKIAYPLREALYGSHLLWRGPEMQRILEFAPQAIFTMVSSLSGVRMVNYLARRLGIPIVPLITDDWITTEYSTSYFSTYLRSALVTAFEEYLALSPVRLVISDAMAEAYTDRYGGTYAPFTQAIEARQYDPAPHKDAGRERVRMVYAGHLAAGRWQGLLEIGQQLAELDREGIRGELVVYSNPFDLKAYASSLADAKFIRLAGTAPASGLPAIYHDADVLVHVESFDPRFTTYTALSLSTKLSEYLMAGRCLFGYGPEKLGALRHMAKSNGAVVVGTRDATLLKTALRRTIVEGSLRTELGDRGRKFALLNHEMGAQHRRFRRLVRQAVISGDAS